MAESNAGEVLLAFLVGGLVGAAVGLLYAPRSGTETRQRIKGLTDDLSDRIKDMGEDVRDRAGQVVADAKDKIISQKERMEAAFRTGEKVLEKK